MGVVRRARLAGKIELHSLAAIDCQACWPPRGLPRRIHSGEMRVDHISRRGEGGIWGDTGQTPQRDVSWENIVSSFLKHFCPGVGRLFSLPRVVCVA